MTESTPQPRGVFAAVLTPLTDDMEPDLERFLEHCGWLLENGCDGIAPLGTTGEANSLSMRQRLRVIEALGGSTLPRERIIVGTGACALDDAVTLCRAATEAGLGGQLVLPPFYYKSPTEEGLRAFYSALVDRVGSASMRLYLYHFPQMSTVPIPHTLVLALRERYGPVVAGLKDSSGEWAYTERLLEALPGFGLFSGTERFLLANLRAGGAGCISATANSTAPLCSDLYRHWESADAEERQARVTEARLAFEGFPAIAAQKALKARLSGQQEWLNILPPLERLPARETARLWDTLAHLDGMRSLLDGTG